MSYKVLPSNHLEAKIKYHEPSNDKLQNVTLASCAMDVLTDLKKVKARTIKATHPLEEAEAIMKNHAVRMLLVVANDDHLTGILTYTDISGEKPMQYINKYGGTHKDILIQDIMTEGSKIEVLKIENVAKAKVGDIIETLKNTRRTHALVVDHQGYNNDQTVRGIFSASQIAHQLGFQQPGISVMDLFEKTIGLG